MTPPFSFAVRFEDQPPPTRAVRVKLPYLRQPGSSRLGNLDGHWQPSHTLDRIGSRDSSRSAHPPPQRLGEGQPKTFRISQQRDPNAPWAAASFNPGM
jgi:hypothetical protein